MEPYGENHSCPKCEGTVVEVEWHKYCEAFCQLTIKEHMHRTCVRCGYKWAEAPLDTVGVLDFKPLIPQPPSPTQNVVADGTKGMERGK